MIKNANSKNDVSWRGDDNTEPWGDKENDANPGFKSDVEFPKNSLNHLHQRKPLWLACYHLMYHPKRQQNLIWGRYKVKVKLAINIEGKIAWSCKVSWVQKHNFPDVVFNFTANQENVYYHSQAPKCLGRRAAGLISASIELALTKWPSVVFQSFLRKKMAHENLMFFSSPSLMHYSSLIPKASTRSIIDMHARTSGK